MNLHVAQHLTALSKVHGQAASHQPVKDLGSNSKQQQTRDFLFHLAKLCNWSICHAPAWYCRDTSGSHVTVAWLGNTLATFFIDKGIQSAGKHISASREGL